MQIRPGHPSDAEAATRLLRRSIAELCWPDHNGDPRQIADWLANKTPDTWRAWCANPSALVLVAVRDGQILGAGMMTRGGEILLNYVLPEARFQGVSTGLIAALEDEARRSGLVECRLESTRTAADFYHARGYRPLSAAEPLALHKHLAPGDLPPDKEKPPA